MHVASCWVSFRAFSWLLRFAKSLQLECASLSQVPGDELRWVRQALEEDEIAITSQGGMLVRVSCNNDKVIFKFLSCCKKSSWRVLICFSRRKKTWSLGFGEIIPMRSCRSLFCSYEPGVGQLEELERWNLNQGTSWLPWTLFLPHFYKTTSMTPNRKIQKASIAVNTEDETQSIQGVDMIGSDAFYLFGIFSPKGDAANFFMFAVLVWSVCPSFIIHRQVCHVATRWLAVHSSDHCSVLCLRDADAKLLFVSKNGYGKRVPISAFSISTLGRMGVIGCKVCH